MIKPIFSFIFGISAVSAYKTLVEEPVKVDSYKHISIYILIVIASFIGWLVSNG